MKTSILFNLDFAKNIILSRFFFFFLIIGLYLLISVEIFNTTAKLVVLVGIPIKETKTEIEIHPVNVEAKTQK